MDGLWEKIPSILILAVLVGIFVALRRHVKSPRLTLWITAWVLIFIHFFVQIFEPKAIANENLTFFIRSIFAIDYGVLQLSAMFFIASLTTFFDDKKRTFGLLCFNGLPVVVYSIALCFSSN